MAKVERRHREAALRAVHGQVNYNARETAWLAGDRVKFVRGSMMSIAIECAEAIADAEARGYAACQSDVAAHLRDPGRFVYEGAIALEIERGEHVGKAKP